MSSIPGEVRLGEAKMSRRPALPTGAWFYFAAVVAVTTAGAALLLPGIHEGRRGWTAFIVLSTCAAIAQFFVVRTTRDQAYHTERALGVEAETRHQLLAV
jgi:hypothetical protein